MITWEEAAGDHYVRLCILLGMITSVQVSRCKSIRVDWSIVRKDIGDLKPFPSLRGHGHLMHSTRTFWERNAEGVPLEKRTTFQLMQVGRDRR